MLTTTTTTPTVSPPEQPSPPETAPAGDVASPTAPVSALAALAADGQVTFYRVRASGKVRRVAYLTGQALEHAEWFAHRIEAGESVKAVAAEAGVSRASVRRALAGLALVEEVEAGELDEVYSPAVAAIYLTNDQAEEDE